MRTHCRHSSQAMSTSDQSNEAAATSELLKSLDEIMGHFSAVAGTIHLLVQGETVMTLAVHRGLPPQIIERVQRVPIGKGMAGLAAERREPVQVCNLQTDESGVAKPAAKETGVAGSIAVPMIDSKGG